jgi:hypothetical protein
MKWNLWLAAANRGIWKASELQHALAEHGLVISAGKRNDAAGPALSTSVSGGRWTSCCPPTSGATRSPTLRCSPRFDRWASVATAPPTS